MLQRSSHGEVRISSQQWRRSGAERRTLASERNGYYAGLCEHHAYTAVRA